MNVQPASARATGRKKDSRLTLKELDLFSALGEDPAHLDSHVHTTELSTENKHAVQFQDLPRQQLNCKTFKELLETKAFHTIPYRTAFRATPPLSQHFALSER